MLLLENLERTPWLMGHPLLRSAAFSLPCTCVRMMSSKLSPSKCSPQRIEELSVKDFLPQSFLLSFSDFILQTTLAKWNGSTGCDEQNHSASASPVKDHLHCTFSFLPPIYQKLDLSIDSNIQQLESSSDYYVSVTAAWAWQAAWWLK